MVDIDFTIWECSLDPKRIIIADVSEWGIIEGYDSFIEIQAPGEATPVVLPFEKEGISIITSVTLGLQGGDPDTDNLKDLPDGIYRIKVYGTPESYYKQKYFMKTDRFQLRYDQILLSSMDNCSSIGEHDKTTLVKIHFLLKAAAAQTRLGNFCKAEELYKEAYKLLKNLDCNGMLCREG